MAVWPKDSENDGLQAHFRPTDPDPRTEITRFPFIRRLLKSRKFQFFWILPNQIIFWVVILTGLLGVASPTRNFSTVITWYIWFCAVFLLMVGVGRGWCLMCPFGGFAEWVQRSTFWNRRPKSLTLGRRWSERLSRYGLLPSVALFVLLTYFEEFYNIAAPGVPAYTSTLVLFVIGSALISFLLLERRSFCRYLCPLSALIGTVGATGMVTGFRTRDRQVCLDCKTKDCMRGSEHGYPCPWYEWPGSATSNLMCGLCTECFKSCPSDNIGLFLQKPLTSVIQPLRRRWDIALGIAALLGLVLFQQVNALPVYATVDGWLNARMHFPGYPNPVDYLGIIAAVVGVISAYVWLVQKVFTRRDRKPDSTFTQWFMPIAYGLIPLLAADYLARQLPRFWDHFLRIVPAISDPFDLGWNLFGTAHSPLYNVHVLSTAGVVRSQLIVVALGMIASAYATWRIVGRDLRSMSLRANGLRVATSGFTLLLGASMLALYVAMGGAQ
jgi:polyferredoxin